jgi:3-hydroxybutyryl-CoA dehydrogenase
VAPPPGGEGKVVISGEGQLAAQLREAASEAGYEVRSPAQPSHGELPALIVRCELGSEHRTEPPASDRPGRGERTAQGAPQLILCAAGSLAALDGEGAAAGFHVVGPLPGAKLVELTRTTGTSPLAAARAQRFFQTLGRHVCWVGDCPGLVLGRIVCQLVNECAFALGEGVGSAKDIDSGMLLGLNHPRGPLAWGDQIGLDHVLAVLDALWWERREERYRAAPRLRSLVLEGRTGQAAGAGFFEHG